MPAAPCISVHFKCWRFEKLLLIFDNNYYLTIYPIKNYSGVLVEFKQIKAAMCAPKQQMLLSFWSDNSTAITGDFKHPIVCDFPAGLASEFSRESPKKNQGCFLVFDYSVATIDRAPFNSSDIYLFIYIYTCIDGELARWCFWINKYIYIYLRPSSRENHH